MSLVREALAKAEREAAARAARERGAQERLQAAGQPYRAPRRGLPTPVLVVLVGLPLLAGAVGMILLLRPDTAPPAADPAVSIAAPFPSEKIPRTEGEPSPSVAGTAQPSGSASGADAVPSPAVPATEDRSGAPRATALGLSPGAGVPAAERDAGRTPPAATARRAEPEVFVREAVLDAGATKIVLGGIAWSEAAPLAYLNGQLRGVGESVAGLEIRAIERDRVVLAARDRTVHLRLR